MMRSDLPSLRCAAARPIRQEPRDAGKSGRMMLQRSVRKDGVAEKPGRALVKLAKPSRIEPAEGVRPERLVQLLIDREAEVLIAARKHQSYRLIGEPPVEQGQTVGLGIALAGLQENGPIAEEHGGGSINEALDACFITVDGSDPGSDVERTGALAQPIDGPRIGDHGKCLLLEQGSCRGTAPD